MRLSPRGKLSAKRTDEGQMPRNSPFVGGCGKCAPHPTSLRSATFPLWGKALHIVRFTVPHYCKKIPPARGLRAAPGARVKKEVLKKIVAVEIVDARRDHIIVDILRQTVGPFRIQKTVHPFGQSVQLQHCNPVSFPSVGLSVPGAFAPLFLSLLYAKGRTFASCILYKLTKVICIF